MPIAEFYANTITVSTTELSMLTGNSTLQANTTDGIYQAFMDLNALTVSETFTLKVYETTIAAGTKRVVYESAFTGVQGTPIHATPALVFLHGWDMTIIKNAGTDRSILWSIRQIA